MKIVLLGTGGGPRPTSARFPSSQAILLGDKLIVVDCGNGVTKQLAHAGLSPRDLDFLLVTHHHVDHSADLGYLPLASWIEGRTEPIQVYGPPPTIGSFDAILDGYAEDIEKRTISTGRPPFRPLVKVHDIQSPGDVVTDGELKISCAFVDHPPFDIALGFRLDYQNKSVVISGDTAPSESLINLAIGADVLIHEVVHPSAIAQLKEKTNASAIATHMKKNHTMLEDVGDIAQRAGVGTLVLSHLVPHSGVSTEEWTRPVAETFDGDIIIGEDLREISV